MANPVLRDRLDQLIFVLEAEGEVDGREGAWMDRRARPGGRVEIKASETGTGKYEDRTVVQPRPQGRTAASKAIPR